VIVLANGQPSAVELHAATMTLLHTISSITAYDSKVPNSPRAEPGSKRVYPYAVLWPNVGSFPAYEGESVSNEDQGELAWEARVTVASGDPWWTLAAAAEVRRLLSRTRVHPRAGLLAEPPGAVPSVQEDSDPDPVRWFVPLVFTTMSA